MIKIAFKSTLLPVLCGLFLFSCGGDTTSESNINSDNGLTGMEGYEEDGEFIPDDLAGNVLDETEPLTNSGWQVNNYAAHLIGERIASSSETANYDKGEYWYYQTKDILGGFASVTGGIEGWKEYVVWRMEDGDDLVGEMTVECGPACGYTYSFYKGQGAEIKKQAEQDLFPIDAMNEHKSEMVATIIEKYPVEYPEDSQLIYRFPQKGTGMIVDVLIGADEIQVPIIKLAWNKTKFSIAELLYDPNPEEGY